MNLSLKKRFHRPKVSMGYDKKIKKIKKKNIAKLKKA